MRYSSAGGASSLRRHVEEHDKSSHENVRKRVREKGVIESEYPKRKKPKTPKLSQDFFNSHKKYA